MEELHEQLYTLMCEPENDAHGKCRPTKNSWLCFHMIVPEIYRLDSDLHKKLPKPFLTTDSDGCIRIRWRSANCEARLSMDDIKNYYLYLRRNDGAFSKTFQQPSVLSILDYLEKVHTSRG